MQPGILAIIPFEIWSRIMKLVLEATFLPLPNQDSGSVHPCLSQKASYVISLSSVCMVWRKVVIANPSFWSNLSVEVIPGNIRACVGLLRLYLGRSGARFSLGLCFCSFAPTTGSSEAVTSPYAGPLNRIASIVFSRKCRKRLSTLTLRYPPETWLTQLSSRGIFPRLMVLTVEKTIKLAPTHPVNPNAHNAAVERDLPDHAVVPFPSLSQLDLKHIPFSSSLVHAILSSTLRDVSYCGSSPGAAGFPGPWSPSTHPDSAPPPSTVLSNVKAFHWVVSHPEIPVFQHIRLPSAERLELSLEGTRFPGPSYEAISSLNTIIQSSQPLSSVALSDLSWLIDPDSDLRLLLRAMEHVGRLEIQRWSGSLLTKLAQVMSETQGMFLPQIRKLWLDVEQIRSRAMLSAVLESLLVMLATRSQSSSCGGSKFVLGIVYRSNVYLDRAFRTGLQKMRSLRRIEVTVTDHWMLVH